ncbi:MAG: hypothetical protein J3K34DRAFT_470176 [Monoraphidium minutum]|nr:MAG: hypothetical protein J3K34DRAFT_470176 [Monoraphidium minutum]
MQALHRSSQQQQQQQQVQAVTILAPPPPPPPFAAAGAAAPGAARPAPGPPAEKLAPEELQEWAACVAQLEEFGLAAADAERIVARAFGWATQAYWRREKVEEPPSAARAAAAVGLLRGLGISDAELPRVIKSFPEVIGCSVEALQGNVAKLQKDWKLEGQVLAKAVVRQPAVLGYTVDCMGDCIGECNRCWARF